MAGDVVAAVSENELIEVPLIGLGYRAPLAEWIHQQPPQVQCLEVTAEHFFDGAQTRLGWLSDRFPLFVHGLGLSLGSPGRLDPKILENFRRVVDVSKPLWISEHVAFTRSEEVDLGHLNPIPLTRASLSVIADHAKELADVCQRPLILENITSHLAPPGDFDEPDFLNALCARAGCGLLLDVTNLFINSRNHDFDPLDWLSHLDLSSVVQTHIVGYARRDDIWYDHHAAPIQPELHELLAHVVQASPVRAIILERDADFPPTVEIARELTELEQTCESARLHAGRRSAAE